MIYALIKLASISPPAGWKILNLVHKKIHVVNFFVNKIKMYHAAAGESSFHRVKHPGCMSTAQVVYITSR